MTPVLECDHVSEWFGSIKALSGVSFQMVSRRTIGLLGSSGSEKSILIKLADGLLVPGEGNLPVAGLSIGPESKTIVSYLPDKNYLSNWMKVSQSIDCFDDFYSDSDKNKVYEMLERLDIKPDTKLKTMPKGTKEKVQLVLVMSHKASLYLPDELTGGADPVARDYILSTILINYNEEGSIVISTHLTYDVEQVLDDVIFLKDGKVKIISSVDETHTQYQKSVDELFREVFRC